VRSRGSEWWLNDGRRMDPKAKAKASPKNENERVNDSAHRGSPLGLCTDSTQATPGSLLETPGPTKQRLVSADARPESLLVTARSRKQPRIRPQWAG
jgi:hypothetical protein